MASYLVTGASRGLGFEFVNQLSKNPENTVIGLVRDKATTETKVRSELGERKNLHIVEGDITNYDQLKASVPQVSDITGGKLDYIIANAALVSSRSAYDSLSVLGEAPKELEEDLIQSFTVNVIGNIHLFNLYTPLILKGTAKKVVALSTGMADADLVAKYEIALAGPYAISKAALNLAVAKFSAQYSKDGVLFFSISPGYVDTGNSNHATPEQLQKLQGMGAAFAKYAPHFTGAITPEASVQQVLSVIDRASVEGGYAGSFISHLGNKQWL
ncbi:Short chain dehydrogenase virK [Paramyrothecium foliicola]|nr:Short chain dehydrogenase virK [Paramyrothecium foliicola]